MASAGTAFSGPGRSSGRSTDQETRGAATAENIRGLTRLVSFPPPDPESKALPDNPRQLGRWCCEHLEMGNILFFPTIPFEFSQDWRAFLVQQHASESRHHKNIAYRPTQDRLTGLTGGRPEERAQLHGILRSYSARVALYLANLLPEYRPHWRLDYASFRPFEEEHRVLRLRARNDLLHTDAFPTRPTNGDRILRFFTNVNLQKPRVWLTGQTFEVLAEQYAAQAGLPAAALQRVGALRSLSRFGREAAKWFRLPVPVRSSYDEFMLRFHHFLKESAEFQQSCPKTRHEFPPGSCWMAFTDMVSHAVLSGQFALEQTFIVTPAALVSPEKAPLHVLERLCGYPLVAG